MANNYKQPIDRELGKFWYSMQWHTINHQRKSTSTWTDIGQGSRDTVEGKKSKLHDSMSKEKSEGLSKLKKK